MAKKSDDKIVLERTYNVPLRRGFNNTPRYKRTKRAVAVLRTFIVKHMKSDDVRLGRHLNMAMWTKGITNPPHHVKVECKKYESGRVMVEIVGAPQEEVREKVVSSRRKKEMTLKDKIQDTLQSTLSKDSKAEADKVLDVKPESVKTEKPAAKKEEPKKPAKKKE